MTKLYTLGVVDEYLDDIEDFQTFFRHNFNIVIIDLSADLNILISNIINSNVDAVAIDYNLHEHNSSIHFNGDDVYEKLRSKLHRFPAFILTNYVPDALNGSIDDKFCIISKRMMKSNSDEGAELISKIKNVISTYKSQIRAAEERFLILIDKQNNDQIDVEEEEELIELDTFLEHIIDKENSLPKHLKSEKSGSELEKLIKLAENIIEKESK